MHIQQKIILLNKILHKKDGILLDYISFSEKEIINGDILYSKWQEYLKYEKDIGIKFYIHLPFCATICKYCMYNTIKLTNIKQIDKYIENTISFLEKYKVLFAGIKFNGIYVGGGTPSLLNEKQLTKLFKYIFSNFNFKEEYYKEIELNPSSTTFKKLDILSKLGFDRISFGVQSFNKETLEKENRKFVSEVRIQELVDYSKKLNFLDINLDIIAGLNGEGYSIILETLRKIKNINPYSITIYTILKGMERSILFKNSLLDFYENIDNIYLNILKETRMLDIYDKEDWSNVLGFTLKQKEYKFDKKLYDAHNENIESLFGVGYKAFGKIWGVGNYETIFFDKNKDFIFNTLNKKQEFYSAFLQSFQFKIDKRYFLDNFGIDIGINFREELDYLKLKKLIKENDKEILYIGDKNLIGFYGILFLDLENLVKFIKYRFYEKK